MIKEILRKVEKGLIRQKFIMPLVFPLSFIQGLEDSFIDSQAEIRLVFKGYQRWQDRVFGYNRSFCN
jgi:hypothetical protein